MADDDGSQEPEKSGSGLRAQLEETLRINAELTGQVTGYKAGEIIREKGLKNISAEDLKGVPLNELEAKAIELDAAKAQQATNLLRSVLAGKGLTGEELEAAVNGLVGSTEPPEAALARIRAATTATGTPPGQLDDLNLTGPDLIRKAFRKSA